jgi:plasmid stabilization system protein ParE
VKLRYTRRAAEELDQVLSYIEGRSPAGAHRVKARIQAVIELIASHPQSGQLTSTPGLRRVVVHPYPYLIFYAARDDEVVIHGVRHAARRRSIPD